MGLEFGDAAPWFDGPTASTPRFNISVAGGRYVIIGFLPPEPEARRRAMAWFTDYRALIDDRHASTFLVARDDLALAAACDVLPGLRWYLDRDGAITRLYGAEGPDGATRGQWLLLDPTLRVLAITPFDEGEAIFRRLAALPPPDLHAGCLVPAPVLIVPRVFEPELCRQLIDLYDRQGGQPSGVMREVGGRTVGQVDDFKRRRDANVDDEALRRVTRVRIGRRLIPEIRKAFQFSATRIERYIVACYDAADGGFFRPHRDNTTKGTAHRRFACSINLNAEDHDGGDLRFPEFGAATYRPPTGGAVVFSCSVLHEATPVTRGRRYAFLPFLFDEAGEQVRQENLKHLDPGAVVAA